MAALEECTPKRPTSHPHTAPRPPCPPQVDRILAERPAPPGSPASTAHPVEGGAFGSTSAPYPQQGAISTNVQYLVKWQGLPYGEATWESAADLARVGAMPAIDEFQVREERGDECVMCWGVAMVVRIWQAMLAIHEFQVRKGRPGWCWRVL